MSGMSGGSSMLRARRKDVNVKPNRKLDRKSSRGMIYENEELRLRTININAEIERGQTDIKKLKRENEQLKREILALRHEYERLDTMLRERSSSPQHSDDSGRSCCSACEEECLSTSFKDPEKSQSLHVAFDDLSVVPEEDDAGTKSPEVPECECDTCKDNKSKQNEIQTDSPPTQPSNFQAIDPTNRPLPSVPNTITIQPINSQNPSAKNIDSPTERRTVDVLLHDAPASFLVTSVVSPPPPGFQIPPAPAPPGFTLPCEHTPRFHTGGNIEDLLGEVEMGPNVISTEIIQQNSVFMCNTRKIIHKREPCQCQKLEETKPKHYITEKNIELYYDYPKIVPTIPQQVSQQNQPSISTSEVSTVVFVDRRIPVKPKSKFDIFFRSQSAPVGENEEPIYATVKKLPKRLRRMDLTKLEKELAYKNGDTNRDTSQTDRTDTEESIAPHEEASRSETEKPPPTQRPDTPKAKKRRRFSFTFKKRNERKNIAQKEKKIEKKSIVNDSESEHLVERVEHITNANGVKHQRRCRHRPRTTTSSVSSGPRSKRDSYQDVTSHSEHERTDSISSSVNSNCSLATHKSRKISSMPRPDTRIPWCGCWGTSCI